MEISHTPTGKVETRDIRVLVQDAQRAQLFDSPSTPEARGCQVTGEFVDAGVSGTKESRPRLNAMMADAKRRRFYAVLVWKLDRFALSLKHLVNALAEFCALGVKFVSLTDGTDLSTPSGRLMFRRC